LAYLSAEQVGGSVIADHELSFIWNMKGNLCYEFQITHLFLLCTILAVEIIAIRMKIDEKRKLETRKKENKMTGLYPSTSFFICLMVRISINISTYIRENILLVSFRY